MGGYLVPLERAHRFLGAAERGREHDGGAPLGERRADESSEIGQRLRTGREREPRMAVARAQDQNVATEPLTGLGGGRGARSPAAQIRRVDEDAAVHRFATELRAAKDVPCRMKRQPKPGQGEGLAVTRGKRGGFAQRPLLRPLQERERPRAQDGALGQRRASASRMGEKADLRAPDRIDIELRPAHAQTVRRPLDGEAGWGRLSHIQHFISRAGSACTFQVERARSAVPTSPVTTPRTIKAPPESSRTVSLSPMSRAAQRAANTGSSAEMRAKRTEESLRWAQVWMPKANKVAKTAR